MVRISDKRLAAAVLVAALGYFVDVFDIWIFTSVRVPSLKSLGIPDEDLVSIGAFLLKAQMAGMLAGGVIWGVLGDKIGRIQVLFGSILLYSLANLANAGVDGVVVYAVLRFVAGLGLAGEIGAGITLVAELMPAAKRGLATTIVATVGVSGAIAAGIVGELVTWRVAYLIGGVLGLLLLFLRVTVSESELFRDVAERRTVRRGSLTMLFLSRERLMRYVTCALSGLPIWYVAGIITFFSPEVASALGISGAVTASRAAVFNSVGIAVGDLCSGLLSQYLKSRRKAMSLFLLGISVMMAVLLLLLRGAPPAAYYSCILALGFFSGYWAVFVTTAAEQFGTNMRSTVATTIPNVVRGLVVPMSAVFVAGKDVFGVVGSAAAVGVVVIGLGGVALLGIRETFTVDLNYLEE